MNKAFKVMDGIEVIPNHVIIPMMGFLPVNAFVIKAKEPVLIDTGIVRESDAFIKELESVIDPKDLKWIWITHDDADHTGSLTRILELAPDARLIANALAILRMNTIFPIPMDRVMWLNPGESIDAGDRKLTAFRPPLFDNPTAIGIIDEKTGVLFSVDCFGGILPKQPQNVEEIETDDLVAGMMSWASADSPWVHFVNPDDFGRSLDPIRKITPEIILSSHMPPAMGKTDQFLDILSHVPGSMPFVAPDQGVLDQILAQVRGNN